MGLSGTLPHGEHFPCSPLQDQSLIALPERPATSLPPAVVPWAFLR